jgi:hypothetical protein
LFAVFGVLAFPQVVVAQTGDPLLDSWIAPHTRKGGNTSVPLFLNPAAYPDITGCNSGIGPSWETNCPSDLTFTPNANTGGYQAFGVGISSYPASEYWDYGCYMQWQYVWHNDSGWQEELVLVCDYQLVSLPAYANGEAGGRLRWGASQFYYGFPAGNWTLSTLAFKGSGFAVCAPAFNGTSAPCGFGLM